MSLTWITLYWRRQKMRNFKLREFECKCGCGLNNMDAHHLIMLDDARDMAGIPFIITSGSRCMKHNLSKEIGGSITSSHPLGYASDILCQNSRERYKIVRSLLIAGFRRIGIEETFIHADNDPGKPQKLIWL